MIAIEAEVTAAARRRESATHRSDVVFIVLLGPLLMSNSMRSPATN